MSANGHAYITVDEFDRYRSEVLRVSGDVSRVVKALEVNTNQMAKLTETCRKLDDKIDRRFDIARRRLDSYSDEADEKRTEALVAEVKRLRSLPRKILQWASLVLGVGVAAAELAHRVFGFWH